MANEVIRNLASVGIRLDRYVKSGRLRMISARTITGSAETYLVRIKTLARGAQRPLPGDRSGVHAGPKSGNELTAHSVAERLIDWSKADGITLVCTSLLDEMSSQTEGGSPLQISTLADTWIHLNYLVQAGERNRGLSIIKSRGTAHSNQVRELILSDAGVTLADIYTAGGEVLMGTLRWEKESAERVANEVAEVAGKLKRVRLDAEEAELEVRVKSLQTELVAKQVEKALLARTTESREGELSRGRTRMRELRGGRCGDSRRESEAAMSRRVMFKFRLYVAGDAQNSAQARGQPRRALPGTPAGPARDRNRGRVPGAEARAGGRHLHDADARQARAVSRPKNRRHAQPDAARVAGFGTGNRSPHEAAKSSPPPDDANEEISALIETLHETEQRLEELTAGEVDTVADRDGRTFLLRRAQEQLRHSEAAKQAAILNALPAHIALLDTQGHHHLGERGVAAICRRECDPWPGTCGSASTTSRFATARGEMTHPRRTRSPPAFVRCWAARQRAFRSSIPVIRQRNSAGSC